MQHKMHVRAMKHIPWVIKFYEGNGQEMCRLCLPSKPGFIHPMRTAWARKKLTNKQTNKREKLKKETITKNKKTKQNKQTKRNKSIFQYILYLQICEFKREL